MTNVFIKITKIAMLARLGGPLLYLIKSPCGDLKDYSKQRLGEAIIS